MIVENKVLMKMSKNIDKSTEISESILRKDGSETSDLRKTTKCAKLGKISMICELHGYDIKALNSATGKGSYMLKVGTKDVVIQCKSSKTKKDVEQKVTLALYKFKGLRGLLRRAAEARLLKLIDDGKNFLGPCTPTKNVPHEEILKQHEYLGYHEQGSCKPACFARRLYGSLKETAMVRIFPPYIAKPSAENLPAAVTRYLVENIEAIFNLPQCVVYHNGSSVLKTETFNIINRATDQAINNFMKHSANGTFKFKIVFNIETLNDRQKILEDIGFFVTSLFEITRENGIQLGACKTNGSGRITIDVTQILADQKFPAIDGFIQKEIEQVHAVKFGDLTLTESEISYQLDLKFAAHCRAIFETIIDKTAIIEDPVETEA